MLNIFFAGSQSGKNTENFYNNNVLNDDNNSFAITDIPVADDGDTDNEADAVVCTEKSTSTGKNSFV